MNFSNRLRLLRKCADLTQKELGDKIGVSQRVLAYYENENRFPDENTLKKIADLFDVSIDYLLGRTDNKHEIISDNERIKNLVERINELDEKTQSKVFKMIDTLLDDE